MNRKTIAHLAVLSANLFFGINFTVVKYVVPQFMEPIALNVCRVAGSVFLFWLLFLLKPTRAGIDRKDIPRFFVCALSGVALNQVMFIKGLALTTSIHASLLILITPIVITFIAAWVLKERITALKIIGLLLGISGAVILIVMKDNTHTGNNILVGDILIALNAITYAFYLVWVRPLMHKYSPVHVIRWVFTLGAAMIIPYGWASFSSTDFNALDAGHWAAVLFVVTGGTFFAYLFNIFGVKVIGASATGAYIYTQPVFGAIIAILFLGENYDGYKFLSAILIFAGVYLANYKSKSNN